MGDSEIPQFCDQDCIGNLIDPICAECQEHYDYWCAVDDSEMDIDWSEYNDMVTSEWDVNGE